jgi:hypothetical protein
MGGGGVQPSNPQQNVGFFFKKSVFIFRQIQALKISLLDICDC